MLQQSSKLLPFIMIPEGYEVQESPQPLAIALPNKAGSYKYIFNQQGSEIQVVSLYKINKSLFAQTEYQSLKQFHDMIVAKHAEQIVLKKITE